ncbi:YjjI family glycine radical enzyme [Caloramator sp. CAR-1]|uniref:YjjI family glycine radical enzyme n=1 Tax=Caloramator sp. CAR-1 TaxID=3062777 RepID=UPI0026E282CB|nr:YjjI family glycine radical enzyme [Caloramator sp. CAR-1]MDO6354696.1 YjjI family glycine radical enzyme [Caloramator sp. CAR-1]
MDNVLNIIKDFTQTYHQKLISLARAAENSLNVLNISDEAKKLKEEGIICDLNEGNAPYRPRYIVVDFEKFFKNGSDFLRLNPPNDIWEATNNLLILYKHIPSITSFPVYIGNIDYLLEPFIEDEKEAYKAIKLFLEHIDRTITDSFCHANIGPKRTKAGEIILKITRELQNSVPNITLKYSDETDDDFAIEAVLTSLDTAKPSFANHDMFIKDLGEKYAIASCYNGLPIGGGSYTLVRLNLAYLAKKAKDEFDFLDNILPYAVDVMANYMDERIRFLVEESNFFQSSFLVKEGLIDKDRFTAMFGIFGLAECVNYFINSNNAFERFGHGKYANELGIKIIEKLDEEVKKHKNNFCKFSNGNFLLHAQVGIDTDKGISPGCRIPIGEEPELPQHLLQSAPFHKYFPSGIGDVFSFDVTAKNNPEFILDIIKGSFASGLRYISFYGNDSDVIRITGYLVKKSDIEKLEKGEQVYNDAVVLGLGSVKNQRILERKVRKI